MTAVAYRIAEGISCRGCGGVMAEAHDNEFGLCKSCWVNVSLFCGAYWNNHRNRNHGKTITDGDVTSWLANKLKKDTEQFMKTGISGRCEAIRGGPFGAQCARRGSEHRDGHLVCRAHGRATAPQFVNSGPTDPYLQFSLTILSLCRKDPAFARMISDVAFTLERPGFKAEEVA